MELYFKNNRGEERKLADVKDSREAMTEINKFCDERKFKIYYVRGWIEKNGDTVYDVGSHTEFFILRGGN